MQFCFLLKVVHLQLESKRQQQRKAQPSAETTGGAIDVQKFVIWS